MRVLEMTGFPYFSCCCLLFSLHIQLRTPWTVAHQAPLSMRFFMQEYWSGLPFPSSGDLPDPETKLASPALHLGYLGSPRDGLLSFSH